MFTIAACLAATAVLTIGAMTSLIANDLDEDMVHQSSWADSYVAEPVPAMVEWIWDESDYEFFMGSEGNTAEMLLPEVNTTPEPAPEVMAHLQEVTEENFEKEVFAEISGNTYEASPRSMHTMTTVPPVSVELKAKAIKLNDTQPFKITSKAPAPMAAKDMQPVAMDKRYLDMVVKGESVLVLSRTADRTVAF